MAREQKASGSDLVANMTGGEAMVLTAKANGIQRVFGIPGVQTYPLFDALHRHSVEVLVPPHEQGAAYMAMGAAKSTGKPEVFSVVPGVNPPAPTHSCRTKC